MFEILEQFDWWSALDVVIIACIIYQILIVIRGTRAAQMLTGVVIVLATFLLSSIFPLSTLNWAMAKFYPSVIIILIILFQDDIRHALSKIGKKSLIAGQEKLSSQRLIDEVARAAELLATKHIGALVVFERNIILSRYVDIGVQLDSKISKELLLAVFHPTSPIHDGAIIIQKGRITAAGCFLPLTRDDDIDLNMGTRHRAAIGISQETDAVVLLVSEEKGSVMVVIDGKVGKKAKGHELRQILRRHLIDEPDYEGLAESTFGKFSLFSRKQKPQETGKLR